VAQKGKARMPPDFSGACRLLGNKNRNLACVPSLGIRANSKKPDREPTFAEYVFKIFYSKFHIMNNRLSNSKRSSIGKSHVTPS
jgi:hypothetical protein